MSALERLRRACEPVQEDSTVPPKEHRVTVDRRDLIAIVIEYDLTVAAIDYELVRIEEALVAKLQSKGML